VTLTIAIPTFNRMAQLERVLRRLAPQLDDRCDILVLDNASAIPVAPMVADVLPAGTGVRVLRHRTNIGAHANIHRAIELAEGKWVWVLGDDDLPTEDAIARIFAAIDADTSAVFINFTTTLVAARHERPATLRSTGLDAFIEILDLPNSLNFMSSSVWKTTTPTP
jgi:glycosyltransferase involved in cell wall biosynthesis